METIEKNEPLVRISYDEMEAYLLLPAKAPGQEYSFTEVLDAISRQGVKFGVENQVVMEMIEKKIYSREMLVATGIVAKDGVDGFYTYNFDRDINKKPKLKEDGSVDYWSIHSVEMVREGQVVATYTEPIDGIDGMTVRGRVLRAKRGRPQIPISGRGFTRSEDGRVYTADYSGKIEMINGRIQILKVLEVTGDVDMTVGNIDFRGDVIVHGDVKPGAVVRATGTITVDGLSEGCYFYAGKDIILRGGMIGGEKSVLKTKGNLIAKFIEYTTVEAEGYIQADSAMNCNITSYDKVYFAAGHASVVGGVIYGCAGIEAKNFGNDSEIRTEVHAGVHKKLKIRIYELEKAIAEDNSLIDKISAGIAQFDQKAKETGEDISKDERRVALLRTRIAKQAGIVTNTQELTRLRGIIERSQGATVRVLKNVYPGVEVTINDSKTVTKHKYCNLEFVERDGKVVMLSMV